MLLLFESLVEIKIKIESLRHCIDRNDDDFIQFLDINNISLFFEVFIFPETITCSISGTDDEISRCFTISLLQNKII